MSNFPRSMVCWMIDKFGTEEQRSHFVPLMASMEKLGSYCLTEPGAGSDAASLATTARREGDTFIVNGKQSFLHKITVPNRFVRISPDGQVGTQY